MHSWPSMCLSMFFLYQPDLIVLYMAHFIIDVYMCSLFQYALLLAMRHERTMWQECSLYQYSFNHNDVIKWEYFPRYWPFVRGIHWSPVNSPHKGQWRGALMFSLICAWINVWVNNREAGDLRHHRAHYDVIVMNKNNKIQILMPHVASGILHVILCWDVKHECSLNGQRTFFTYTD